MNVYLDFLTALYGATKKMRLEGAQSIIKHLKSPERSPFFSPIMGQQPEAEFLIDALHMVTAETTIEELMFYLEGYRSRLVSHEKANIHLTNLIYRTVWAIAHNDWDAFRCTEYGRATIPREHSLAREAWVSHCNSLEIERTQTNVDWGSMLDEINQIAAKRK